jgi:NAD(P)-dependent dehydrogenase (short-subunit alcohol dehydrogenase family)
LWQEKTDLQTIKRNEVGMKMNQLLENKIIVVTGGAGLLGTQFVRAIVSAGGTVIAADKNLEAARGLCVSVLNECPQARVEAKPVDITSRVSVKKLLDGCVKKFGRVDGLVNCAYPRTKSFGRDLEEVEYKDFCDNVNIHLGGYFVCCQQFAKHFAGNGGGSVVNIASIYGVVPPRFDIYAGLGMRNAVEYGVIKAGLIHMSKYFVKYYEGRNVRVNVISPGGLLDKQPSTFLKRYRRHCLNKGMLEAKDICGTLVFLLSDMSTYINGQNLIVDDGFTL